MRRFLTFLSAAALAAGLACSSGISDDASDLPLPAIFAADAPETCGDAGATAITLDPLSVVVTESDPLPSSTIRHHVTVTGVISGLAAGSAVYGVIVDDELACPVISQRPLPIAADGVFTAELPVADASGQRIVQDFRILVVTGAPGATFSCPADQDCLRLMVGATEGAMTGLSNAIGVRL
jgi:hypothetical protein